MRIGNNCHISTRVNLNGQVIVKDNTFIGSGAIIKQGVKIGKNCIIGMGKIISKDVKDNSVLR